MGQALSSIVFQPPNLSYTSTSSMNYVWLHSKQSYQLPAIYLNQQSAVTILFSHGNGEDL
eukprot:gene46422-56849_t